MAQRQLFNTFWFAPTTPRESLYIGARGTSAIIGYYRACTELLYTGTRGTIPVQVQNQVQIYPDTDSDSDTDV